MYLEKSWRCRFLRDDNFDLHMCESNTIFMSLLRSKNVWSLLLSLCVPIFEPLRFVDVIVILLAELGCESLICVIKGGHMYHEDHWVAGM